MRTTGRISEPWDDSTCPVSDGMLSRLYRADSSEIRAIALELPEVTRMQLAVFCYTRSHLREIGRQVIAVCDRDRLVRMAGRGLGICLGDMRAEQMPHPRHTVAKITLPTARDMRRRFQTPLEENVDED